VNPNEIIADLKLPPIASFVERVILPQYAPKESSSLMGQIKNRLQKKQYYIAFSKLPFSDFSHQSMFWKRLVRHVMLIQASHFETLREFENAAKIYKSLGMYEKAGDTRAKRDELIVKKTEVTVNLNALLQQVKDGGIVAIYRCPNCNGKLKVGSKTTLNSLRTCEHCGSEIEAVDLADFLKTALS
jgi:DNA-directed RNA polymerase subunit RPC12/RpoP